MELLKRLQNWYKMHCDGDWEHSYGVAIDTLDNPGWKLSVDLTDTLLEDVEFLPIHIESKGDENSFWMDCQKNENSFIGMGSADSLENLLATFLDWADANSDTSDWDVKVDYMVEQCKNCGILEQLRQLYWEIDSVPPEHRRKKELVELFNERWNLLIGNL